MREKYLIVGLGNPGSNYSSTWHNVGFMFLDYIAYQNSLKFSLKKSSQFVKFSLMEKDIVLLKPLQYMNCSGIAVSQFAKYYDIEPSHILVCYDDIAFPFAHFKLKHQGSAGGHNGIKSLIEYLKTEQFLRLRIGIHPEHQVSLQQFVLHKIPHKKITQLEEEIFPNCYSALNMYLLEGIAKTMSFYNA